MARKLEGTVVADKAEKTVTVAIDIVKSHPVYRKQYKQTKKYLVHDEKSDANIGDWVSIVETRPISKRKRWKLDEVLERGADS